MRRQAEGAPCVVASTRRDGRVEAVRGVSFEAAQGSLVTLVGANGAGKSSVINAVSGMVRPSAGRITFEGKDVTRTPAHRLVGRGLVQVPEGRQILATLTIEENLRMGAWHTGGTAQRSIDAMYDRFPVLAQRRADRRRRIGVACLDLQLDEGEDFFSHKRLRSVARSS